MQGLLTIKRAFIRKDQRVVFFAKIWKKITIVIKNVIGSEGTCTLMNKAGRPSNYFFHLIKKLSSGTDKKEVACIPVFVQNTEESILKYNFHLHTWVGRSLHSRYLYRYTFLSYIWKMHPVYIYRSHGWTFEKYMKLLFTKVYLSIRNRIGINYC